VIFLVEHIDTAKKALDVVDSIEKLLEKLGPYKPEIKSMTIDHLNKSSILKMLITAPSGHRRSISDIEIPAYRGYSVYEVFDAISLNKINLPWILKEGKWVVNGKNLPSSEKYFIILRGSVDKEALDEIVRVHAPEDPDKDEEEDRYWLHSALNNISILEKIYAELSIERVALSVKIGVQKSFSTSVPEQVRDMLEAGARADAAMSGRDREEVFRAWLHYRTAKRSLANISPQVMIDRFKRVLQPEVFVIYLKVPEPYRLEGIIPTSIGLIPESVGVNVHTDLTFIKPAAEGKLVFKKKEFGQRISSEFEELA